MKAFLLPQHRPDPGALLIFATGTLLCLGLVMVASASMDVAQAQFANPFYFFQRHLVYVCIGLLVAFLVWQLPLAMLERLSIHALMLSLLCLVLVLVPHVGRRINGSIRWLGIGPLTVQPSELAKLASVLYLSGYLVRRQDEIRETWSGLIKALMVLGVAGFLLMMEPDFGATIVIMLTAAGMLWLAGTGRKQTVASGLFLMGAGVILAFSRSYRVQRMIAYIHPWDHPFYQGYQLTQSLIAFGRGGWTGLGLGNSVQKLFYLPEAHTDFVFAVFAEEFGLVGVTLVVLVFLTLVLSGLYIGYAAEKKGQLFGAYLAYGLSVLIGVQTAMNLGVTAGALPTKGLTLPLVSYGGSSLLVELVMMALILRVHRETQIQPGKST